MVIQAKVMILHWDEQDTAIQEATLEVQHLDGSRQMFVIPILRMTPRLVPCECGCGKVGTKAAMEFNHPEDYRDERG